MAKKLSGSQIVTANHLRGGDVVYFTGDGDWSVWVDDAAVADGADAASTLLEAAVRTASTAGVVEPFLIEVESGREDGRILPVRYRERLRALGPSIHPMFGKQAGQHASLDFEDVSHVYANGI